jgi:hypothetical protein
MKRIHFIIYLGIFLISAGKVNSQSRERNIIQLKKMTAYEKGDRLFVQWATNGLVATNYFEVQCSTDGKTFKTIAVVLGPDPKQAGDNYQFMGRINSASKSYYRVCHIDKNGGEQPMEIIEATK